MQKSFAVITGASSGIGYELAAQFARNNFDILIVAENDEIEGAAVRLSEFGNDVMPVKLDLAAYEGVKTLYRKIASLNRQLDAVAINAGIGVSGAFAKTDLAAQLHLIDLNVTSPVHLARLV